ncbi:hypothetical protein ACLRDC_18470 [Gluconacetobacter sacchari]|uniref:Uncharacterized protein n=2 Tax=Gluconacetobacter sacchari TaxID=92759 RepID=A0A7W4IAG3_9PROT|nr:hypothetical protein [Gluconacetobacter sacchari]MBB2159199.1 hypothetical protein [Gluconacetobacter sacchari]GBQ22153.1 hypothetical protein AA12717_1104 [Gluconacetobacter sacchari DSM 12717]
MRDDYYGAGITALDVAATLLWTGGSTAMVTIRRHIARCLEAGAPDEAEFWLKVRNQVEALLEKEKNSNGLSH